MNIGHCYTNKIIMLKDVLIRKKMPICSLLFMGTLFRTRAYILCIIYDANNDYITKYVPIRR